MARAHLSEVAFVGATLLASPAAHQFPVPHLVSLSLSWHDSELVVWLLFLWVAASSSELWRVLGGARTFWARGLCKLLIFETALWIVFQVLWVR